MTHRMSNHTLRLLRVNKRARVNHAARPSSATYFSLSVLQHGRARSPIVHIAVCAWGRPLRKNMRPSESVGELPQRCFNDGHTNLPDVPCRVDRPLVRQY